MDIELVTLFGLWYAGNIGYNEWNKATAEASDGDDKTKYAMTIATMQLGVGVIFAVVLWGTEIRKFPSITQADWIKHIPAGVCSAAAHAASVFSLAAGGVAFGQIVKAAEPVFAALVGVIFYGKRQSIAKWLCLIPIIGGVILASLGLKSTDAGLALDNIKLDFSIGSLVGALVANLFAAFKNNENHKLMEDEDLKKRIGGPSNQFAISTIVSLLASIPLMIYKEKDVIDEFISKSTTLNGSWPDSLKGFAGNMPCTNAIMNNLVLSGVAFYMYNEWATLSLKKVDAATQSVANTAKRVFVIGWGVMMHGKEFGLLKQVGCTVCLLGVYANSNIDNWLSTKEKTN